MSSARRRNEQSWAVRVSHLHPRCLRDPGPFESAGWNYCSLWTWQAEPIPCSVDDIDEAGNRFLPRSCMFDPACTDAMVTPLRHPSPASNDRPSKFTESAHQPLCSVSHRSTGGVMLLRVSVTPISSSFALIRGKRSCGTTLFRPRPETQCVQWAFNLPVAGFRARRRLSHRRENALRFAGFQARSP